MTALRHSSMILILDGSFGIVQRRRWWMISRMRYFKRLGNASKAVILKLPLLLGTLPTNVMT